MSIKIQESFPLNLELSLKGKRCGGIYMQKTIGTKIATFNLLLIGKSCYGPECRGR